LLTKSYLSNLENNEKIMLLLFILLDYLSGSINVSKSEKYPVYPLNAFWGKTEKNNGKREFLYSAIPVFVTRFFLDSINLRRRRRAVAILI